MAPDNLNKHQFGAHLHDLAHHAHEVLDHTVDKALDALEGSHDDDDDDSDIGEITP